MLEDVHIAPLNLKEQPKSKWDDEDVDENDVKESWEDEDEPAPAPAPPSTKLIEKAPKKSYEKATDKKGKKVVIEKEEPVDHLAEKLHQQRYCSFLGADNIDLCCLPFTDIGLLLCNMAQSLDYQFQKSGVVMAFLERLILGVDTMGNAMYPLIF
ncbi:hypothetical protein K1719_043710 [Acacia pycnantha]|nr:hypothetical protein K1719_043710 [Acacia pycnantha]